MPKAVKSNTQRITELFMTLPVAEGQQLLDVGKAIINARSPQPAKPAKKTAAKKKPSAPQAVEASE